MNNFRGKTVVLTGCNRGIGKSILCKLAEYGANVFTITREYREDFSELCSKLANDNDIFIKNYYADFANQDAVVEAGKKILKEKTKIDILINNVGIGEPERMLSMTKEDSFRNVFEINFFSSIWLTKTLSRNMMRYKSGSIVFVSSSAAFDGGANVEYCASKAALIGATKRLALELGNFGIRVNSVAPALTDTDMGNSMSEEDEKIALSMNIMHRKGTPEEIANAVLFLASDEASFITAQILRVDGGLR